MTRSGETFFCIFCNEGRNTGILGGKCELARILQYMSSETKKSRR
ncbi:hypothetical protein CLOSTASPAR_00253 [[Clostridium] asparagiforme DSM 15981]|uniref:Uncharacterized protein n=1 Tax=[Clostridium] asparagiforme DSM 15981 TaxID=518636 RepID=C0CTF5_9FIRM|nr:hypothetical protein CLOSTASPAR_00253 [[Clostridium] asparagiforme DSM 15981]